MSDTRSKFEAAMTARKKQKAEESSRQNGGGFAGYTDIPWAALYNDTQQVFRFAGLPYLVREKGTDSKRIFLAMIVGDDDKKFCCIGPDPEVRKDWILYRVMNKVLDRKWNKDKPSSRGKGDWDYTHALTHTDLYNRCAKNNNLDNAYETGWKFRAVVLINVIDRANYDWHLENKKYRLLSKKASDYQDKTFFDVGVPDMLYKLIEDDIVACDGNVCWEDYDIVIKKVSESPWYKVYHGVDDAKKLDADVKALVQDRGLTPEEQAWEMNDIDKLFSVTTYKRIKEKLGLFFQRVDKAFNCHYYDELCGYVEKEEGERADKEIINPPSTDDDIPQGSEEPIENPVAKAVEVTTAAPAKTLASSPVSALIPAPAQPAPVPLAPVASPTRSSAQKSHPMTPEIWDALANGTSPYCLKDSAGKPMAYIGIPKMSDADRAWVRGVFDDGSFDWLPEAGELFEGTESRFLSPENLKIDPLNGKHF
ncbi:hypothetical protein FACS1894200_10780 [Spirochaetia bacterium]|nr:hypothetical protein FACS1894200_10780 [Spirochaetia bacterium]